MATENLHWNTLHVQNLVQTLNGGQQLFEMHFVSINSSLKNSSKKMFHHVFHAAILWLDRLTCRLFVGSKAGTLRTGCQFL